jgi:hypothetical protein
LANNGYEIPFLAALGSCRNKSLRQGLLPFLLRTGERREAPNFLIRYLFRKILNRLTQQQTAGVAMSGMFKQVGRLRIRQLAGGYFPPNGLQGTVRRRARRCGDCVQLSESSLEVFMHLYKPLARLTLTQVVSNFIQSHFLARSGISSPWAFGQPFDLLQTNVVPNQVHTLLFLVQRL